MLNKTKQNEGRKTQENKDLRLVVIKIVSRKGAKNAKF